jgi:hypothetical protein
MISRDLISDGATDGIAASQKIFVVLFQMLERLINNRVGMILTPPNAAESTLRNDLTH